MCTVRSAFLFSISVITIYLAGYLDGLILVVSRAEVSSIDCNWCYSFSTEESFTACPR
jgi:hypothetical protein